MRAFGAVKSPCVGRGLRSLAAILTSRRSAKRQEPWGWIRTPFQRMTRDSSNSASRVFSQEPLIEFLAGLTRRERPASVPDFVDQVESRPAEQSSLPELDHVASQIAHLTRYHGDDHPWAVGYRAARAVRDTLGIGSDHRFASHAILARRLGSTMFEPAKLFSGVRALVSRPDGGTRIHLHDHRRDSRSADAGARSNNFAFARAVGDAVCFLDTRRSVINDLHHAERQATGRAFARSFLHRSKA